MPLVFLTDRSAVHAAIQDFDRRGRDAFLDHHGYGRAKDWFLPREVAYGSKAIAGAAAGMQQKGPALHHKSLSCGRKPVHSNGKRPSPLTDSYGIR